MANLEHRARMAGDKTESRVALVLSSLAGFVSVNALVLAYDTGVGNGPFAGLDWPIEDGLRVLAIVLGPLAYAVATWRLGVRGAVVALAGVVFIGPLVYFVLSPLGTDSFGGRGLNQMLTSYYGILAFVVVMPITIAARKIWR